MKKLYLGCLFTLFCVCGVFAQRQQINFEVFFEFDKATLKEESKQKIDSVLRATSTRRINTRISGYTCDLGSDNYNMGLSEQRATAAFEYIKGKGESESKLGALLLW